MSEQKTPRRDTGIELNAPPHEQQGGLPAVVEQPPLRPQRRWRPRVMIISLLLMIGTGAGIGWVWWQQHQMRLPPGQLDVDATAMVQAGLGSGYAQQIITDEISSFLSRAEGKSLSPVNLVVRIAFNPNVSTAWFTSVMGIINSITMLAIILAGAAVVREREHGTMEHLLVMPLTPLEIAMAKIWANSVVITVAAGLSLYFVVGT